MAVIYERQEILDNRDTFVRLTPGSQLIGSLGFTGDSDWVRVSLVAGESYLVTLSGQNPTGGLVDPLVTLRDQNGHIISSDRDAGPGRDAVLRFEAPQSGTYFLEISPQAALFNGDLGAYALTFDSLDEVQDAPADVSTSFSIAPGESFTGTTRYRATDQDWIAVNMVAGETYFASLEGFGNFDPAMQIFDADGTLVAQNNDFFGQSDAFVSYTATTTGTYYVQAMSLADQGAYTLRLGTGLVEGPDAPTHAATPYSVSLGERFTGRFDTDETDHDIIATQVTAGTTYFVTLSGSQNEGAVARDTLLEVIDPDALVLAVEAGSYNGSSFAVFHATTDGTIYLDASPTITGVVVGDYELTVSLPGDAIGTANADLLVGRFGADRVELGAGDDLFFGFGGNDTVFAGAGNDSVEGGSGFDVIWGGDGQDTLEGGANADNIFGQGGADWIEGGEGFDRLFGGFADDYILGDAGSDALFGQQGNDTLWGGVGNDRVYGGAGNDFLYATEGDNRISGGAGFDTIVSGSGDDVMSGNFNADIFFYLGQPEDGFGHDTITDFDATNDLERIHLWLVNGIDDRQDLFDNHLQQVGNDVVISIDEISSITLLEVRVEDLGSRDFYVI